MKPLYSLRLLTLYDYYLKHMQKRILHSKVEDDFGS